MSSMKIGIIIAGLTLFLAFACSLFLIFYQPPYKTSEIYAYQSMVNLNESLDADETRKDKFITKAKSTLLKAIAFNPQNTNLWLRYIVLIKLYPDHLETIQSYGFRPSDQTMQILKKLNMRISKDLNHRVDLLVRSLKVTRD